MFHMYMKTVDTHVDLSDVYFHTFIFTYMYIYIYKYVSFLRILFVCLFVVGAAACAASFLLPYKPFCSAGAAWTP